jgi:2-oxoglutarate ferredoxin oxidoreductase subunit delta
MSDFMSLELQRKAWMRRGFMTKKVEKKAAKKAKSYHLKVDRERCKACYLCQQVCPKNVFDRETAFNARGYQPICAARPQDCIGCKSCTIVCPDVVFELYELGEVG